jgi:hypothetical protein
LKRSQEIRRGNIGKKKGTSRWGEERERGVGDKR